MFGVGDLPCSSANALMPTEVQGGDISACQRSANTISISTSLTPLSHVYYRHHEGTAPGYNERILRVFGASHPQQILGIENMPKFSLQQLL